MDHDFLKGGDRERPFAPPPERPILHWLSALLILLSAAYAGYRAVDWWNHRPPTATATPASARPGPTTEQTSRQPLPSTAPEPGTRVVTKCLTNGKTAYSDSDCAMGARPVRS
jgi:hypothetical protein